MDKREQMVDKIGKKYGLVSSRVLSVMLQIPREVFAPRKFKNIAYNDGPIPIGHGQTMSQPYTVAFMTDLVLEMDKPSSADVSKDKKVLEIGTGSGYQAAVLSKLVKEVYTVEIVDELAHKARKILKKLSYNNVYVLAGSGEWGWKEKAPFDAIIVTAGVGGEVPKELFDQLKIGGVLVAPVGGGHDKIMMKFVKKSKSKLEKSEHGTFHFVPFVERG
jgi:protein-L-isoaspartate(D-aspartate) O-methyltransferase